MRSFVFVDGDLCCCQMQSTLSAAWMEVYRGLGDAESVQKGRNFRK